MGNVGDPKWIRFQQRLSNLKKIFAFFEEALAFPVEGLVKQLSIIKSFEIVFELSWKCLRDALEYQGVTVATPRSAIQEAYRAGFIGDGQAWIDYLGNRNELVDVYDEDQALPVARAIGDSAPRHLTDLLERLGRL